MRSRVGLTLAAVLLIGGLTYGVASQVAQQQAPAKIEPLRFEEAIEAFEAEDLTSPPPKHAVVVTGSSSVRRWHSTIKNDLAPLTIIPRGFGGSTMEDALYWIDRVAIAYEPRAIVIYEGDNDTGNRYKIPPARIAEQFERIVEKIHAALPQTRIYAISVKPSVSRREYWPQAVETNQLLEKVAARNDFVTYIDVASPMLQPDGQVMTDIFVDDNLHLNPKGYEIWTSAVREVLIPAEGKYEGTD
jgi:lysophospholipase L1-like esterase